MAKDSRYNILDKHKIFTFLDVQPQRSWTADRVFVKYQNISTDGKNITLEKRDIIFAAYFFLDDVRIEHVRIAYTISSLISKMGGLFVGLINGLGLILMVINR